MPCYMVYLKDLAKQIHYIVNLSKRDFELEMAVIQGTQFSHLLNGVININ